MKSVGIRSCSSPNAGKYGPEKLSEYVHFSRSKFAGFTEKSKTNQHLGASDVVQPISQKL